MYEVEYKVEITKKERDELIELFEKEGFLKKPETFLKDYFPEVNKSEYGGFNPIRYRDEGVRVIYTKKTWEKFNNEKIRKEIEHEVSREDLEFVLAQNTDTFTIQKHRQSFSGKYDGLDIHIDMDRVKFDHSPGERYFIEAETMSENKENVEKLRKLMIEFIKKSLNKTELIESPGMFSMAYKKL